jgi:Putative prokaryotic signal transducing protein
MDTLKYELLIEVNGRLEADFIKSYLEAEGIAVEIFQEAVGHIYALTVDGLGLVQIFVPKTQIAEARELMEAYQKNATSSTEEEE